MQHYLGTSSDHRDVDYVRRTVLRRIHQYIIHTGKPVKQVLFQRRDSFVPCGNSREKLLRSRSERSYQRNALGSGAYAFFLLSAGHDWGYSDALFYVYRADSLDSVYLVSAERDEVCAERTGFHRELHIALNTVAVSHYLREASLHCRKSLPDRQYIACFVVNEHHTHKAGRAVTGCRDVSRIEFPVFTRRNPYHLKAFLFEVGGCLSDRSVFHRRNDNLFAVSAVSSGNSAESEVVALGCSGGKIYTYAVRTERISDDLSRLIDRKLRIETCTVQGRGVAVILSHCRNSSLNCRFAGLCCSSIIKIN